MRVWVVGLVLLLPGCLSEPDRDGPNVPASALFTSSDGVKLSILVRDVPDEMQIQAWAERTGWTRAYSYAGCTSSWDFHLVFEGREVDHWPLPELSCMGFYEAPFNHGDRRYASFEWNRTLWNHDQDNQSSTPYDAPPGDYEWRISFQLYEGENIRLTWPFRLE